MIKVVFTKYPIKKAYPDDAAYDIHSLETVTLKPFEWHAFKTGVYLQMPTGMYAQILPRSGLSLKHALLVLGGVIDPGYRGEVHVILYNAGKEPVTIREGDRIAQVAFIKLADEVVAQEHISAAKLEDSDRGSSGFGSTGR